MLLTRRAVVRAKNEAVYGEAEAMGANDGVLVSEPTFSPDLSILQRDNTRRSLSKTPHIMGRKLAKMEFSTELRGNGKQHSGNLADAPIIARLFRMCGYALVAKAAQSIHGPFMIGDHTVDVTVTADATDADNTTVIPYFIEVTTGGASGVAEVTITSDIAGEGSAEQVVTTATPLDLGTHGATVTLTFAGDLVVGQRWVLWLLPTGLALVPISDNFESGTLEMYKDGIKHVMPGAFGTFELEAKAGEFAKVSWTFTGIWVDPIDEVMPSPSYERTLPAMVELARLRIDNFPAIVETVSFNQNNDIQVRPDVSSSQGYIGTRIVDRNPEGGINPEAETVATHDFWGQLGQADRMPFQMRVGHETGNTVWCIAPGVQYTGLTYADRNGLMTYDAGLKFGAYQDDDEVLFFLA